MRLVCPNCVAQYEVADGTIPESGRDVQCANCNHIWFQDAAFRLSVDDIAFVPEPGEGPLFDVDEPAQQKPEIGGSDTGTSTVFRSKRAAQYARLKGDTDTGSDDAPSSRNLPQVDDDVMDILRSEAAFSSRRKSESRQQAEQPDATPETAPDPEISSRDTDTPRPAAPRTAPPTAAPPPLDDTDDENRGTGFPAAPQAHTLPGHSNTPNWADMAAKPRWDKPPAPPEPAKLPTSAKPPRPPMDAETFRRELRAQAAEDTDTKDPEQKSPVPEDPVPFKRPELSGAKNQPDAASDTPAPSRIMGGQRTAVNDLSEIAADDARKIADLVATKSDAAAPSDTPPPPDASHAGTVPPDAPRTPDPNPQAEDPADKPATERLRIRGLTVEQVDSASVDKAAELAAEKAAKLPAQPETADTPETAFPTDPEQPLPGPVPAKPVRSPEPAQSRMALAGERKVLLPDIEELNTSLRMDPQEPEPDLRAAAFDDDDPGRGKFGLGLVTALMLFGIFWALYLMGPAIADTFPVADPYIVAFRAFIDTSLDKTAQALVPLVNWLESL